MEEESGQRGHGIAETGKRSVSPRTGFLCLAIFLGVSLLVSAASLTPLLEYLELANYDIMVRFREKRVPDPEETPIVIVEFTEDEIDDPEFWDYPIPDENLTQLLRRITDCGPAVVGVDIFRSAPVPKNGHHHEAFEELLASRANIVMIKTFGDESFREIPAPGVLERIEDGQARMVRVAFADFPADTGFNQKTRRALLHQSSETDECYSLAFVLASWYLPGQGMEIGQTENGDAHFGGTALPTLRKGGGGYSLGRFAENSSFLLNFTGEGHFPRYSFKDVMSPEFDDSHLRGKIVLVGVTAESVHDVLSTPLLPDHRGIVLHALTLQQFIDMANGVASPTGVLGEGMEFLWIFLASLSGAAIGFFVLRLGLLLPAMALATAGIFLIGLAGFQHFLWIPTAAPAAGFLLSSAGVSMARGAADRRDRKTIEFLFGKAVGKEFSDAIWRERRSILQSGRMIPREMPATILMTDLKNFTRLSRKLNAEDLFEWLNDYLGMVSSVIGENGGVSKDFAGDAVHGAFGLPIRRETDEEINRDAVNAVHSALQMREAMARINEELNVMERVSMRVGIATGSIISGSLGSSHLMRFDFIGEVANVAARLESVRHERLPDDDGCRILINEETYRRLEGRIPAEDMGEFELKGTGTTRIYRIL